MTVVINRGIVAIKFMGEIFKVNKFSRVDLEMIIIYILYRLGIDRVNLPLFSTVLPSNSRLFLSCCVYPISGSWVCKVNSAGVSGSSFESLLYIPMIQKWNKRNRTETAYC